MNVNTCLLEAAAISTSIATLYTAPAQTRILMKKVTVTNPTAGAITVSGFYLVPSGGSAGDTNALRKSRTLASGECWEVFEAENHALAAGDFVAAQASGAGLTCRISGQSMT